MAPITATSSPTETQLEGLRAIASERLRLLLVGTRLARGELSANSARQLTGDSPEAFTHKMQQHGFASIAAPAHPPRHWHRVAERFEQEGFLDGRSQEVEQLLDECRFVL